MRDDLVDVTVVLDRSGSMESCKVEAENGLNHFIDQQRQQSGECLFSLVQFDTDYEFVHQGEPIGKIPKFTLIPRGMTALLDAVGRAITETGERLAKMTESDRPGLVVFVIITDGQENSSHEFTKTQIKTLIEQQQTQYQWQFTFLGANQDAFAEAQALGISAKATANYRPEAAYETFAGVASNVSRMRKAKAKGKSVACSYTDEERDSMS